MPLEARGDPSRAVARIRRGRAPSTSPFGRTTMLMDNGRKARERCGCSAHVDALVDIATTNPRLYRGEETHQLCPVLLVRSSSRGTATGSEATLKIICSRWPHNVTRRCGNGYFTALAQIYTRRDDQLFFLDGASNCEIATRMSGWGLR